MFSQAYWIGRKLALLDQHRIEWAACLEQEDKTWLDLIRTHARQQARSRAVSLGTLRQAALLVEQAEGTKAWKQAEARDHLALRTRHAQQQASLEAERKGDRPPRRAEKG